MRRPQRHHLLIDVREHGRVDPGAEIVFHLAVSGSARSGLIPHPWTGRTLRRPSIYAHVSIACPTCGRAMATGRVGPGRGVWSGTIDWIPDAPGERTLDLAANKPTIPVLEGPIPISRDLPAFRCADCRLVLVKY